MGATEHTRNMLLRALAMLWERAPDDLAAALARFGFRPGDVTFRYPRGHHARRFAKRQRRPLLPITEVKRWPWEAT